MSSQFPDLKSEMDQISVPVEKLDNIIAETVSRTKMKRTKKRIVMYSISAAVVGFGLFLGSAMVSPAIAKVASNIPVVGTFFNDVGDEGLKIAGQKGLTQVVDQTVKDNGVTLTMNEIFYDGSRLTLGYTQESLLPVGGLERPTILVDGKEINFGSGFSGEFVTPGTYKGIINVTLTEELPEEFEMNIVFDAVGLLPGNWEFAFPVKQSSEVTVIKPKDVIDIQGAQLSVDSLKIGPAGTDLRVKVISDEDNRELDPFALNYYIVDDQGNRLEMLSGSGHGDTIEGKMHAYQNLLYERLVAGVKKIKVIPYDSSLNQKDFNEETILQENGFEIEIP